MFEKFTERLRKVMSLGRQEAQRLNSEFIGTEHILLGILQEGHGVGGSVLKRMQLEPKAMRVEIQKLITPSSSPTVTLGQLPFSPRAKRVIELAEEEASSLNSNVISTGHCLIALYRENEGIACQVLKNLGVDYDRLRAEVTALESTQEVSAPLTTSEPDPTQAHLRIRLLKEIPDPEDTGPYVVVNGCYFKDSQTIELSGIMSDKALEMVKVVAAQHGAASYIVEPFERQ